MMASKIKGKSWVSFFPELESLNQHRKSKSYKAQPGPGWYCSDYDTEYEQLKISQ